MYIKGNQGIILNPKAVWIEEVNDGVENIFRNMLIQSGRYED